MVFCFTVQNIFFRTTQEFEYLFFLSREAQIPPPPPPPLLQVKWSFPKLK